MPQLVSPTTKRNVLWPIRRGPKGWLTGTMIERYRSAVRHLLRTPRGSIIWAPTFGTRLEQYRTQVISEEDQTLLAGEIAQSFEIWIPDIRLTDLSFGENNAGDDPDSEELFVNVTWGIPNASAMRGSGAGQFAYGPVQQLVLV